MTLGLRKLILGLAFLSSATGLSGSPSFAGPAPKPIDFVFDLDWTLFYVLPKDTLVDDRFTFRFDDEVYRLADFVPEVLADIESWPGARVSFFSGGTTERNEALLKMLRLPDGRSAWDIAYKVLNRPDLTKVSDNPALKFSKQNKKDLSKINPNLGHVVIADDTEEFVMPNQISNQLWLGATYTFYSNENDLPRIATQYDPPSRAEWKKERLKILSVWEAFRQVYRNRDAARPADFLPAKLPEVSSPCPIWLRSVTP
ncbi:MAG: hypothetical protein JNL01_13345 [Bdellovibrionales bacterium]|nr:hypothetical protein [Bdellovibrionales bacterium]